MKRYELTVEVSIYQTEYGAWQAKGKDVVLLLEAGSRPELIRYVVDTVQALAQWLMETKPEGQDMFEYCQSVDVGGCTELTEEGLPLAVRELEAAMDEASEQLAITQRIPV